MRTEFVISDGVVKDTYSTLELARSSAKRKLGRPRKVGEKSACKIYQLVEIAQLPPPVEPTINYIKIPVGGEESAPTVFDSFEKEDFDQQDS